MIAPKMLEAFNAQIGAELQSAYLYLSMSSWCEEKSLKGFAHWLRVQLEEEQAHAFKLMDHVVSRGGSIRLPTLEEPRHRYDSLLECFRAVLEHEQAVTAKVHALYRLAVKEDDPAAQVLLQWYVSEQVEEEAAAQEIVDKLAMAGERGPATMYLDREYGKRSRES